jgi:hypothetical protein
MLIEQFASGITRQEDMTAEAPTQSPQEPPEASKREHLDFDTDSDLDEDDYQHD